MVGSSVNISSPGGHDGIDTFLSGSQITVSGSVNTNVPGTYTVTYSYTNKCGLTTTKTSTWIVKEYPTPTPTINTNPGCYTGSWNGIICVCSGGYSGTLCEIAPKPVYACESGWDVNQPCDALVHGSPRFPDLASCQADRASHDDLNACVPVTNNGGTLLGYS